MKLTNADTKYLEGIGVPEEDFGQIEEAAAVTKYTLFDADARMELGRIPKTEAVKRLGREGWLNGLARSAFHWTAMRQTADKKNYILFESKSLFD